MKQINDQLYDAWYDLAEYSQGRRHMNDFFGVVGTMMRDRENILKREIDVLKEQLRDYDSRVIDNGGWK